MTIKHRRISRTRLTRMVLMTLLAAVMLTASFGIMGGISSAVAAEETTLSLTLNEAKEKHQFIVSGDTENFEVDLILPDGTVLTHTDLDPEQYIYLGFEEQRIWVLQHAPAGTYTFRVISDTSGGRYRASAKDAIEMPHTEWQSPLDQSITITSLGDEIPLAWQASGDHQHGDRISIYLQRAGTDLKREIARVLVSSESLNLSIPSDVPDGEYKLTAEADNGSFERQVIDPAVTIIAKRGREAAASELLEQTVEQGIWTVDLTLPSRGWDELVAEIANKQAADGETMVITAVREDLIEMEAEDGTKYYRWYVAELTEDGEYVGNLYLAYNGLAVSPVMTLTPVEYVYVDEAAHEVKWSIEGERTGLRYMDVSFTVAEDSEVVLRSDLSGELARLEALAAEGPQMLQIALSEGETLYELEIRDRYGNSYTYSKRIIADHTPPLLEMIQPLPTHREVPQGRVSGFVEPGSAVQLDGREVEVQADGYFVLEGVKGSFTLTAVDESGNETRYQWEPQAAEGFAWWPIAVIVVIILLTVGTIWWLRRTRAKTE